MNPGSVCLAALLAASLSFPVQAAVTVFGNGMAHLCSEAAHHLEPGQPANARSIDACNHAISAENLSLHDLAGSHINRCVLLITRADYAAAKADFDAAAALMPDLGEAYSDRGAALLGLGRYADAIAEIDRGLALSTTEPEKAYYNRALANEALDNPKAAYFDYSRAAALRPDWPLPRIELTRFTVAAAERPQGR